jgi:hypothetical protein
VTILADRGFGDVNLFAFLESLCFDYAIDFAATSKARRKNGETRPAADWSVWPEGRGCCATWKSPLLDAKDLRLGMGLSV